MNPNRIAPLILVALLAGCAGQLKHEISVSKDLREVPVRSVFVFDPVFPDKLKKRHADDLLHMQGDRRAVSLERIRGAIVKALSASLTVESGITLDAAARDWALQISRALCKGRVPLVVDPIDIPVESVMLVGVKRFGWENTQMQVSFLWFEKKKKFGPPRIEHNVSIQVILVNPRTGAVLMDALDEQRKIVREGATGDEAVLDEVLAGVVREVTGVFPEPPGGWTPRAAAPAPTPPADAVPAQDAVPAADGLAPSPAGSATTPH